MRGAFTGWGDEPVDQYRAGLGLGGDVRDVHRAGRVQQAEHVGGKFHHLPLGQTGHPLAARRLPIDDLFFRHN